MKTVALARSWFDTLRRSRWFNKYSIALSIFFIWMLFFDKHNMIVQYRLSDTLNSLEHQIDADQALLDQAYTEKEMLEKETEKYAREKYHMHRPDEDVYIVEPH